MLITTEHFRTVPYCRDKPGYCLDGGRAWFKRYGLSCREFIRRGLDEQAFLATGDALGIALVEWAHQCAARDGAAGDAGDAREQSA
jgi:hypothetical protein